VAEQTPCGSMIALMRVVLPSISCLHIMLDLGNSKSALLDALGAAPINVTVGASSTVPKTLLRVDERASDRVSLL